MKKNIFVILIVCLNGLFGSYADSNIKTDRSKDSLEIGFTAKGYIYKSINYFNQSKFDESIEAANKAILLNPDTAIAYDIICFANCVKKDWQQAIINGEKAFSLSTEKWENLVNAYIGIGNRQAVKEVCQKVLKYYPDNQNARQYIRSAETHLGYLQRSNVITVFLILIFILCLYYGFKKYADNHTYISSGEILLMSGGISCLLYFIFFLVADYLHSVTMKISASEVTRTLKGYIYERDGIEGYFLFFLFFTGMIMVLALHNIVSRYKSKGNYLLIFIPLLVASSVYVSTIKFLPAESEVVAKLNQNFIFLFGVLIFFMWIFSTIIKHKPKILLFVACVLLLPVCFITTSPISVPDFSYIWAPALRILNGFSLSQIYFQYDLFLSLLAAIWMKLNLHSILNLR